MKCGVQVKVITTAVQLPLQASQFAGQTGEVIEVVPAGSAGTFYRVQFLNGIAAYLACEIEEIDERSEHPKG